MDGEFGDDNDPAHDSETDGGDGISAADKDGARMWVTKMILLCCGRGVMMSCDHGFGDDCKLL